MRLSPSLLFPSLAVLLSAAAIAAGACSSSNEVPIPPGMGSELNYVFPGTLPEGVPSSCSGSETWPDFDSDLCGPGNEVIFICSGGYYSEYTCTDEIFGPVVPTYDAGESSSDWDPGGTSSSEWSDPGTSEWEPDAGESSSTWGDSCSTEPDNDSDCYLP